MYTQSHKRDGTFASSARQVMLATACCLILQGPFNKVLYVWGNFGHVWSQSQIGSKRLAEFLIWYLPDEKGSICNEKAASQEQ